MELAERNELERIIYKASVRQGQKRNEKKLVSASLQCHSKIRVTIRGALGISVVSIVRENFLNFSALVYWTKGVSDLSDLRKIEKHFFHRRRFESNAKTTEQLNELFKITLETPSVRLSRL